MAKPTLMQSLLGRPSQTYSFPQEPDYFSSKAHMVRAAQDAHQDDVARLRRMPHLPEKQSPTSLEDLLRGGGGGAAAAAIETGIQSKDVHSTDVLSDMMTPKGTTLLSSTSSSIISTSSTAVSPDSLSITSAEAVADDSVDGESDTSEDDDDIFYTPLSTPRSSMAATTILTTSATLSSLPREKPRRVQLETRESSEPAVSTRTPLPASASFSRASISSVSSSSLDGHSIFSTDSFSTDITTPVQSESGKSSRRSSTSSRRRPTETYYTGEDWAKDVRWLTTAPPKTRPVTKPAPTRSKKAGASGRISKNMTKHNSSLMMNMTALMEEDEEKDTPAHYDPRSHVIVTTRSRTLSSAQTRRRSRSSNSSGTSSGSGAGLRRRRSRSLESRSRSDDFAEEDAVEKSSYVPELPSQGTAGFTSLTLPRAPQPAFAESVATNRGNIDAVGGADGRVDLTRSGVAQTTMASIEVTRGLSQLQARRGVLKSVFGRKPKSDALVEDEDALSFTSYRKPPDYVPSESVLVQVWAVGLDGFDRKLVGGGQNPKSRAPSFSEGDKNTKPALGRTMSLRSTKSAHAKSPSADEGKKNDTAPVGYIPGRSFVGRVLQCGWDVNEKTVRKGDWVVGLLDVRKCGALQEFIVVDRHRVFKVPQPSNCGNAGPRPPSTVPDSQSSVPSRSSRSSLSESPAPSPPSFLTIEELALLPTCGVLAYRAMRSVSSAFAAIQANTDFVSNGSSKGRRVLVLRGHDGVGAMAVQMLVKRGWRVSVHAPLPELAEEKQEQTYMTGVESRARSWGAEEVIFGGDQDSDIASTGIEIDPEAEWADEVGVIARLIKDGDVFDAVLDTVGGKQVWEASERLLRGVGFAQQQSVPPTPDASSPEGESNPPTSRPARPSRLSSWRRKSSASSSSPQVPPKSLGLFTTIVGDHPSRVIPTAGDLFKAGMRSMKNTHVQESSSPASSTPSAPGSGLGSGNSKVGYTWLSVAQDVDWEGEDSKDRLAEVVKMAVEEGVRPWIGENGPDFETDASVSRVLPFERTPKVFSGDSALASGGTVVVTVVR